MLQIYPSRHQPRRRRRLTLGGGEETGTLDLEALPVNQLRQFHQLVEHVEHVDQKGMQEIVLFLGAPRALHRGIQICNVPKPFETLRGRRPKDHNNHEKSMQ